MIHANVTVIFRDATSRTFRLHDDTREELAEQAFRVIAENDDMSTVVAMFLGNEDFLIKMQRVDQPGDVETSSEGVVDLSEFKDLIRQRPN